MLAKFRDRVFLFFFRPASPRPLGLFRIALGLMLLVEAVMVYPALSDLYGPRGYIDATLMRVVSGRNAPSYAEALAGIGIPYLSLLGAVFWARAVAILFFLAGLFTGPATFALWLSQTFLMASGPLSSYGLDRYFHLFLFMMLFFPAGGAYSLDAKLGRAGRSARAPSENARLGLRLLQLALLLTYLNAGVAKGLGAEWWTGDAIWRALHLPEFRQHELWWMGDHPVVPMLIARATVFLETFYIFGVWIPYLGALWALAIIGMHLGIVVFMNLANFGIGMALFNGALFLVPKASSFFGRPGPRRFLVGLAGRLFPGPVADRAQKLFRRTRRYPRPAWENAIAAKGEAFSPAPGIKAWRFGTTGPAILLVHGWGGRGTQMGYFAEGLGRAGFRVVAFDGPGHGESVGGETDLGEFSRLIQTLSEEEGPFAGAVAHSFGAVAVLLAASRGAQVGRLVLVGAPSELEGSFRKFGRELGLPPRAFRLFWQAAEARAGVKAAETRIADMGVATGRTALLIHDESDDIVPFTQAEATARAWPGARLLRTEGLGHRRILKDPAVVAAAVDFFR